MTRIREEEEVEIEPVIMQVESTGLYLAVAAPSVLITGNKCS